MEKSNSWAAMGGPAPPGDHPVLMAESAGALPPQVGGCDRSGKSISASVLVMRAGEVKVREIQAKSTAEHALPVIALSQCVVSR